MRNGSSGRGLGVLGIIALAGALLTTVATPAGAAPAVTYALGALSAEVSGTSVEVSTAIKASTTRATAATTTSAASNPSGQAMPTGDLPGWHQTFADDFNTPVALGSFPGADTKWDKGYLDGTPDTGGKRNGGKSGYYPNKVLSVRGGMLDMYLHSAGGVSMAAAPAPVTKSDWTHNGQLYGRYTARFRSDSMKGYKTAWLLWPDSSQWNDGEVDFPEGDLAGSIGAFSHCAGNPSANCLAVNTGVGLGAWHTATTEWTPGKVAFYLDGKLVGSTTSHVPTTSMHYMLQTESCFSGCPAAATAGHLQIDWVSIYSYQPTRVLSLRSRSNGKYASADAAGGAALIANRTAIGAWEHFDVIAVGNGQVALRAKANNRFVCADRAGVSPLIANRTTAGPWETFTIVPQPDGTVALRAAVNGRYVTAAQAGAQPLIANRTAIGPWEKFTIVNA